MKQYGGKLSRQRHVALVCLCSMLVLYACVVCLCCMLVLYACVVCLCCMLVLYACVVCLCCMLVLYACVVCLCCMLVLYACVVHYLRREDLHTPLEPCSVITQAYKQRIKHRRSCYLLCCMLVWYVCVVCLCSPLSQKGGPAHTTRSILSENTSIQHKHTTQ